MLFLGVFLLALWITGLATANTLGGFIHVLLVLAFMALLSRTFRGDYRRLEELRASTPKPETWGAEKK